MRVLAGFALYEHRFTGGVKGAADRGMEPAYWWDALDNDVLAWLNERTEPGGTIAFSTAGNLKLLHCVPRTSEFSDVLERLVDEHVEGGGEVLDSDRLADLRCVDNR
jgi:hypothetical protein